MTLPIRHEAETQNILSYMTQETLEIPPRKSGIKLGKLGKHNHSPVLFAQRNEFLRETKMTSREKLFKYNKYYKRKLSRY